ncbi:MAG TPA: NUDIX hydrolase [Ginsengibacter sp.]|nr:NUDIX hydrolase [Ginsengibacter sp.]HRP17992.1 NUDIX hydrolase [Ginsengibacter sp.]HRP44327.1 NUDIX hydrolase [Ginsengibacter sp.]
MTLKWKTLKSEYLTKYPYFTSRKDTCEMPDGKIVPSYYVVELPGSVCAVCLTNDNEVLIVKQYRHPIEEVCIELPGGFVDKGETPEIAIRRELQEETAYEFSEIIPVGKIAANPGVLNNFTYFFVAKGGKPHGKQHFDEHEFLKVEKISLQELKQLFLDNKIIQSLHANCIFYALRHLGEL